MDISHLTVVCFLDSHLLMAFDLWTVIQENPNMVE